jgi:hypothetical protein
VEVLPPKERPRYEKLAGEYWNWLMGKGMPVGKFSRDLFFMRANHMYRNVIDPGNNSIRFNFEKVHEEIGDVSTNAVIFCPFADAEFDDGYLDQKGKPIDQVKMAALAELDIKNWTTDSPQIRDLGQKVGSDIVPDMTQHRMQFGTDIRVHDDSQLAEFMDDRFPPRPKPYKARLDGYYIAFKILKAGSYIVTSFSEDPTTKKTSNMVYQFNVSTLV